MSIADDTLQKLNAVEHLLLTVASGISPPRRSNTMTFSVPISEPDDETLLQLSERMTALATDIGAVLLRHGEQHKR